MDGPLSQPSLSTTPPFRPPSAACKSPALIPANRSYPGAGSMDFKAGHVYYPHLAGFYQL